MSVAYSDVIGDAGPFVGALSETTLSSLRHAERAEAARELRAAGFRTRVRQTAGGTAFAAVRQIGTVRVLVAASAHGKPVVGAINDATLAVRGSFVADLRHAASLGMQYAEVISR